MRKFNWYYRQKVGYEDMRALQDNLEEAIQNTILDLFATGFVSGGVVQPTSPASMSVQVTAGRGYDESGNRIFIPSVQTIDLSSYRPSTSGRERWVLIAARFKRVESDPRTDGHGTVVMYRSDPSFEIVVRAGSEAATGSAQKPAKQAGDVIRGYVRVYAGQSAITASDISVAEAENLTRAAAHEVRYGSETVESALNARLPSAGEKAALAGTAGTPSSSNRYVTNSDPRLTDARTPKAHASTHATGGSDPLTPEDIGAAPASHSHSWSEITNKPSTFPPSSHQHSASDVTSGTFPVARGGTGLSSLTAGSYLRAASSSAFELRTPAQVLSDIGAAPASHTHTWDQITNKPSTFTPGSHQHSASDITSGTLSVARGGTGLSSLTAGSYLRAASSSAFELRTPAQVLADIGAAPASHSHDWNSITGKPSTFPPSSHNHNDLYYTKSQIDSFLSGSARVASGTYIGNGQSSRTITVGFTPKLVVVMGARYVEGEQESYGGLVMVPNSTLVIYGGTIEVTTRYGVIVTNGFRVNITPNNFGLNHSNRQYEWMAVG